MTDVEEGKVRQLIQEVCEVLAKDRGTPVKAYNVALACKFSHELLDAAGYDEGEVSGGYYEH